MCNKQLIFLEKNNWTGLRLFLAFHILNKQWFAFDLLKSLLSGKIISLAPEGSTTAASLL